MKYVDLNSDIGESFGRYTLGLDGEIIPVISSANIACGFHAGDPLILNKTIENCKAQETAIGAHPGYPDLMGFGRRKMDVTPDEAKAYTLYQLGAFSAFAKAHGLPIQHLKLHGAFYNTVCVNEVLSNAVVDAVKSFDPSIIIMGLSGSILLQVAESKGLKACHEIFADRGYTDEGTLVPRSQPGAMIHDENIAIERILRMVKENKVTSVNGKEITIKADSICVHGDNAKAVQFVKTIRQALEENDVTVAPLHQFL